MEAEGSSNPTSESTDQGLVRFPSNALPTYYSVKIGCFSRLVNLKIEKYESAAFHASGFNWRLILYPNGNSKKGIERHISLYLAIEKIETLPLGWEVYVTYKLFVFNHRMNKYVTIPDDSVHQIQRFHQENKENGFERLISLDTFYAARSGYLINDLCVFGVEVYEVKYSSSGEALKIIENPREVTFNWTIPLHSAYCKDQLYTEEFSGGKHKWRLQFNPYENCKREDRSSLYLELAESPSTVKKVLADYSLVLKNLHRQFKEETSGYKWFSTMEFTTDVSSRWGFSEIKFRDYKVYKQNDTILVQAKQRLTSRQKLQFFLRN